MPKKYVQKKNARQNSAKIMGISYGQWANGQNKCPWTLALTEFFNFLAKKIGLSWACQFFVAFYLGKLKLGLFPCLLTVVDDADGCAGGDDSFRRKCWTGDSDKLQGSKGVMFWSRTFVVVELIEDTASSSSLNTRRPGASARGWDEIVCVGCRSSSGQHWWLPVWSP